MACLARCSCNSSSSFFKTSWVCHCTSCCMCEKNRHPLWGFLLWNWHVLTKVYPHAFSPKHKPRASYLKLTLLSSLTLDRHPSLHVKNWAIRLHLFFISQFWPHMEDRKTQSSSSFSSKDARAWLNSFASWRDSSPAGVAALPFDWPSLRSADGMFPINQPEGWDQHGTTNPTAMKVHVRQQRFAFCIKSIYYTNINAK